MSRALLTVLLLALACFAAASLPFHRSSLLQVTAVDMKFLPERSQHAFLFIYEPWKNESLARLNWLTEANKRFPDVSLKSMWVGYAVADTQTEHDEHEDSVSLNLLYKFVKDPEWLRISVNSFDEVLFQLTAAANATAESVAAVQAGIPLSMSENDPLHVHQYAFEQFFAMGQHDEAAKHAVRSHALVATANDSKIEVVPTRKLVDDMNAFMALYQAGAMPDMSHAEVASIMIEAYVAKASSEESDMTHHFSVLRAVTLPTDSVLELGTRSMHATFAFLAARPQRYTGVDLQDPSYAQHTLAQFVATGLGVDFAFVKGDDLDPNLPISAAHDVVMIDTLHTYAQLSSELTAFAPKTRRLLIMHDTSPPWAFADEPVAPRLENEPRIASQAAAQQHTASGKKGLWPAIVDFLKTEQGQQWVLWKRDSWSHGMTILRRQSTLHHGQPSRVKAALETAQSQQPSN